MGDVMQGISEDVRFNHEHADTLITACSTAASLIDNQTFSRSSWVSHALQDFSGYYSELFEQNASVASSDETLVATRLREIATAVGDLKAAAAAEQQRRQTARDWKARQDSRNLVEVVGDWITGGEAPPVGPPDPAPQLAPTTFTPQERQPLTGSAHSGTSSARPANLRDFATNSSGANEELRPHPAKVRAAYNDFVSSCGWGSLEAGGILAGFDSYLAANDEDVRWANTVADAFEKAGQEGVVTAPNAQITEIMQAAGVTAERSQLNIDPPQAYGAPPTTGYANDPVNTATGNFLEAETDLAFDGACSALLLGRMYNSLNPKVGAFGLGWSSWTETGLRIEETEARWTLFDGREIVFPRVGQGWERATSEAYWLTATETGHRVTDNTGGYWDFGATGELVEFAAGEGFAVFLTWADGRLRRLEHERGRWVDLSWDEDRVVSAQACDGRRVEYGYDDQRRLIDATIGDATRRYEYSEQGLVCRVIDADGVVEVDNTYDEFGRVMAQRSQHGRESVFTYLPTHVTIVADQDGNRSNTWVHDQSARLVRIVDADGNDVALSRDRYGNVVMSTERDGSVTVNEYDDRSRLVTRLTPTGARIVNEWDDCDRLLSVTVHADDMSAITRFTYEGESRLPTSIVDAESGVTKMQWERGLLTRVVDPTGVELVMFYDDFGDLIALSNAGNTSRLERDEAGRIVAASTPLGNTTRYEWEGERLVSRIDPDGARWTFSHTPAGRLREIIDPLGARTVIDHDEAGQTSVVTDALGRATASFYDDLGNLAATQLPDGRRWEYTHNALSRLVSMLDPEGGTWQWDYDVNGKPIRQEDPTGRAWRTNRSKDGLRVSSGVEAPGVPVSSIELDRTGRIISSTNVYGGTNLTRYDRCGRPIEFVDADGGTTTLTRDPAGRILQLQRVDGTTTSYQYDPATGRLASVTNALGETTRFVTDADNRLVAEVDPMGGETRYEYDANGRLVMSHVPGKGRTTWKYDAVGRVVSVWNRFMGQRQFTYDAAGQLIEARDALGRVTHFGYDLGGRAVEIRDPLGNLTRRTFNGVNLNDSQTDPLGRVNRYGYDGAGRLVRHERATGEVLEWTYTQAGGLHQVIAEGAVLATHHHDFADRAIEVDDMTDPDALVRHRLSWDRYGRLVERSRGDATTRWSYDAVGRCVAVTTPNGKSTRYEYDAVDRCTAVEAAAGRVSHSFNAAGRLVESRTGQGRQMWDYRHGDVIAHTSETCDARHETVIERDDDGRICTVIRDGERTDYVHDAGGQLIELNGPDGRMTWQYDEAGRLVSEQIADEFIRYVYDAAGQLLERHAGETCTSYSYNDAGKRILEDGPDGRTEYTWSALGWLTSVSGPNGVVSVHVNALSELARVNDAELFWNSDGTQPLQIAGEQLAQTPGLVGLGDSWQPTGWREARISGASEWSAVGAQQIAGIEIGPSGLQIAGLEWLGSRVYDSTTRSFLSRDPLDAFPGATWAGNPYSYAGNDPLHAVDPLGLRPVTDEELADYTHRHHTGSFWERNGTAVAGIGVTALGVGLMFVPGGQLAGTVLMSAGTNLIQQGLQNPGKPPDLIEVGIAGATGLIPGGQAATLVGAFARGAATGAAGSGIQPIYTGLRDEVPANQFAGYMAQNMAQGAVEGGIMDGFEFLVSPPKPSTPDATPTSSPANSDVALPGTPSGFTRTDSGLAVPDPPPGFSRTDSGLMVPSPPAGYTQTGSGLLVPDVPAGYRASDSGLLVPQSATPSPSTSGSAPAGWTTSESGLCFPP